MLIKKLVSNNPYINLATEDYYLKESKFINDDLFLFWKNKNTIVIGKNQDYSAEVNQLLVNQLNVTVARRNTGGGAVYQDDGNICFTFIKRNQRNNFTFKSCLNDIVAFLNAININAVFSGRNDIEVDHKKISGNAVLFWKNDYLIHGTLLFDVDVLKMVKLLTVDSSKLSSKGIASVKSRVNNIKNLTNLTQNEFELAFISFMEKKYNTNCESVDFANQQQILEKVNNQFANPLWIKGRNFDFNYTNKIKTDDFLISVNLQINNNLISNIKFYTDSMITNNINWLENSLLNCEYNINAIKNKLKQLDLNQIIKNLNTDLLIKLLFDNS